MCAVSSGVPVSSPGLTVGWQAQEAPDPGMPVGQFVGVGAAELVAALTSMRAIEERMPDGDESALGEYNSAVRSSTSTVAGPVSPAWTKSGRALVWPRRRGSTPIARWDHPATAGLPGRRVLGIPGGASAALGATAAGLRGTGEVPPAASRTSNGPRDSPTRWRSTTLATRVLVATPRRSRRRPSRASDGWIG